MPADFQVRVNRTLNVTTSSSEAADDIFSLAAIFSYFQIKDTTNLDQSWVYGIGQASTCLRQGQAAYWIFIPTSRCVEGTLSGCDTGNGDPANGTAVRACGVATLAGSDSADGTLNVVQSGELERPSPANATLSSCESTGSTGHAQSEAEAVRLTGMAIVGMLAAVGYTMVI
jgi:hypothetical protein